MFESLELSSTSESAALLERAWAAARSEAQATARRLSTIAEFVRCRDLTCRAPGCDQPAVYCDIDHTVAYADGGPLLS